MNFWGFMAASTVQNSAADAIADWLESLFETEEKHSASIQALPFQLVDVAMDPDGFIITLSDRAPASSSGSEPTAAISCNTATSLNPSARIV